MAIAGLVLGAVGALVGVLAFLRDLQLRRRLSRAALAPLLRPHLEQARDFFGTVVARGGTDSENVLSEWGPVERRIQELIAGVSDNRLARAIDEVLAAAREMFALAPPRVPMVSIGGEISPQQRERWRREQETAEPARRAEEAAIRALERLAELQTLAG